MTSLGIGNYVRRLSSFAKSALEANLHDLSLPYRLFLYVTDACNCRCNMCSIWQKPSDGELSTSELIQVLQNARHHVKWMDVTGGEVFLRPDIKQLFHFIAEEMPKLLMFHFATNGLLTDLIVECAQIIQRAPIPHFIVTVSLDGPEPLHTKIRGVPGIWPRCMDTFRRLRAARVPVVFGMTLTEHNHDQYEATLEAVRQEIPGIGHHDFHVNIAQVSDIYYSNRTLIDPPMPLILRSVERIQTLRSTRIHPVAWLEHAFLKNAPRYIETHRSPMLCEALSSSAVLGTRGDLYPCIIFDKPVGNVRAFDYSIARLWETRKRAAIREQIHAGDCPHCWTPCEAYQAIIANSLPMGKNRRHPPPFLERTQQVEAEGMA